MTGDLEKKHTVLLVLCRRVISDLLIEAIEKRPDMKAIGIYNFSEARSAAATYTPQIALVEIPERNGEPALDALDVCLDISESSPGCKIVLLCPEQDKKSVEVCIEAKKHKRIDDFLFYDSSVDYLVSKLASV